MKMTMLGNIVVSNGEDDNHVALVLKDVAGLSYTGIKLEMGEEYAYVLFEWHLKENSKVSWRELIVFPESNKVECIAKYIQSELLHEYVALTDYIELQFVVLDQWRFYMQNEWKDYSTIHRIEHSITLDKEGFAHVYKVQDSDGYWPILFTVSMRYDGKRFMDYAVTVQQGKNIVFNKLKEWENNENRTDHSF